MVGSVRIDKYVYVQRVLIGSGRVEEFLFLLILNIISSTREIYNINLGIIFYLQELFNFLVKISKLIVIKF